MPGRHAHRQGCAHWEYNDTLSRLSGCSDTTPEWRLALWRHARELKQKYEPTEYRDKWDDPAAAERAYAAFQEVAVGEDSRMPIDAAGERAGLATAG